MAVLAVSGGCSSNPETNSPANGGANPALVSGSNTNPANANTAAATNADPTGAVVPYNGVQNLNPNAFNAASDNLKVIPYKPKDGELPYGSRNAPDESVVSTTSRGKDFVETRTFKNHPQLAKVEKITDGKDTKYKVFLKNGKILDAPADKMGNFTALAPNSILEVVGIQPKLPPADPEIKSKTEEKPR
jgi:hypothetical protein